MKRLVLLVLVIALIIVGIAWVTGPQLSAGTAAPPPGPGEAAWMNQANRAAAAQVLRSGLTGVTYRG